MSTLLKEWTADELIAELKRRERDEAAKAAGGMRTTPNARSRSPRAVATTS